MRSVLLGMEFFLAAQEQADVGKTACPSPFASASLLPSFLAVNQVPLLLGLRTGTRHPSFAPKLKFTVSCLGQLTHFIQRYSYLRKPGAVPDKPWLLLNSDYFL